MDSTQLVRRPTDDLIVRVLGFDELNHAIVAEKKLAEGKSLSRKESELVGAFRDLYRDVSEIRRRPDVKNALLDVLEHDLSFLTEVPDNPLLAQHLRAVRAQSTVTLADVQTIKQLAKKVSEKEDEAICATLTSAALKGALEPDAYQAATSYIDTERLQRAAHASAKKRNGMLKGAGVALLTIVGVPLLFWLTPLGGAVAGLGAVAAKGVQLGAIAGSIATGLGLGWLFGRKGAAAAASYGVDD